jgi:hypothetical protein
MNPPFSYYSLRLASYLQDHFPERSEDARFIHARADIAAQAYSDSVRTGLTHLQAEETARQTLFEGLHFSPHDTLVEVLWNEFADIVPQSYARTLAINLLPLAQPVFDRYALSDDFAFTAEYEMLYTELTGFILQIAEDHGIQ